MLCRCCQNDIPEDSVSCPKCCTKLAMIVISTERELNIGLPKQWLNWSASTARAAGKVSGTSVNETPQRTRTKSVTRSVLQLHQPLDLPRIQSFHRLAV